MKRNDSNLTPKSYKSYKVDRLSDKKTEVNILVKKSWFERYFKIIVLLLFIVITIYKIYVGDFSTN
jgi:hypothetical protein